MTKLLYILTLVLSVAAWAQSSSAQNASLHNVIAQKLSDAKASEQVNPDSGTCAFNFVFGNDQQDASMKYCVTSNGNIAQFEIPIHVSLVAPNHAEGYGICDVGPLVAYSDWGGLGDSGNWGTATVVSQDAKSVKIARTTSDGIWTLTQTITRMAGSTPYAKIAMTLRNNSSTLRTAVLIRYADADVGGLSTNNFTSTILSGSAWNSSLTRETSALFGVALQNVGVSKAGGQGFARDTAVPPSACTPLDHLVTGLATDIDGSLEMYYQANIPAHGAVTATVAYKGL